LYAKLPFLNASNQLFKQTQQQQQQQQLSSDSQEMHIPNKRASARPRASALCTGDTMKAGKITHNMT